MRATFILISLLCYLGSAYSQSDPQTVVFKVRKDRLSSKVVIKDKNYLKIATEPEFVVVEENATFQGGDINDFRKWVQKNLLYPEVAVENFISGKVIVQFAVDTSGKVVDVNVMRSLSPSLDKETIRVVESSPKWVAAKQGGKIVKQLFTIPVEFIMQ